MSRSPFIKNKSEGTILTIILAKVTLRLPKKEAFRGLRQEGVTFGLLNYALFLARLLGFS